MALLYKNPLNYDPYNFSIEKDDKNNNKVYNNNPRELIIVLDSKWSRSQIEYLIYITQRVAKNAIERGKKIKQDEIKNVLGINNG